MSGRLSFLPGEVSLAANTVVTTNSEKSADAIVGERRSLKGRTIIILKKQGGEVTTKSQKTSW